MRRRLAWNFSWTLPATDDHVLEHLLLVKEFGKRVLQSFVELLEMRSAAFFAVLGCGAFCQSRYFSSTSASERAHFLDQVAQIPQVALPVGDFLIHHHPVEPFLAAARKAAFQQWRYVPWP